MLTKVRVTQEQADVLHKVAKMVKDIPADKVIRALEGGFEIAPTYEIGDWVVHTPTGSIEKIIKGNFEIIYTDKRSHHYFNFRHATQEEIAKEKERRWWAKHGRNVWELKPGDIVFFPGRKYREVTSSVNDCKRGDYTFDECIDVSKDELINGTREVVCFAEDRKDA